MQYATFAFPTEVSYGHGDLGLGGINGSAIGTVASDIPPGAYPGGTADLTMTSSGPLGNNYWYSMWSGFDVALPADATINGIYGVVVCKHTHLAEKYAASGVFFGTAGDPTVIEPVDSQVILPEGTIPDTLTLLSTGNLGTDLSIITNGKPFARLYAALGQTGLTDELVVTQIGYKIAFTSNQELVIPHGVNCHSYDNGGYFAPQFPQGNGALLGDMTPVRNWCRANGIHGAINQDTQRSAIDLLTELTKIANCAPVYSGDVLNLIPLDEVSAAGNGAIYISPTSSGPIADLTDKDFVYNGDEPPIQSKRQRHANCDNVVAVQFVNRTVDYADDGVAASDACSIALYGTRKGGTLDSSTAGVGVPSGAQQFRAIHDPAVARKIASILVKVSSADIWTHTFTLKAEWFPLEAGDLVTITDERMGYDKRPVRLRSVKENSDMTVTCEAEDFVYGLHHPDDIGGMNATGTLITANVDPGVVNEPLIFEPNQAMLGSGQPAELWFVVSGSDPNYGGCIPYVSIDGGASYSAMGSGISPGVTGVLTGDYPTGSDPDTTNTLAVDLSESRGSLTGQTQATADASLDQCYIDTATAYQYEVVCPTSVALTSQFNYSLSTYVRRGVKGTTIADHPTSSRFAVLNSTVYRIALDPQWIGKTLHFKFAAYNLQHGQQNSLANCVDYTYTPQGVIPEPGGPSVYFGNVSATVTGAVNTITLDSTPVTNSVVVSINGTQTTYSISDSVITLPNTVYTGTLINVFWATSNPTPGGITLSLAGGAAPPIRGSAIQSANSSSFNIAFPSGTIAGDMAIVFAAQGYNVNTPSGWTAGGVLSNDSFNGGVFYKVLTAGDISTGYVTVTTAGGYYGVLGIVTLVGNTAGTREVDAQRGTTSPISVSTSASVSSTDLLLYFGASRSVSTNTVNRGTLLRTVSATEASGCIYSEPMTANGLETAVFSFTTPGPNGNYCAVVVVQGM